MDTYVQPIVPSVCVLEARNKGAGFEVVEAMGADDAVRILETRLDIHVVFTDIDMRVASTA